MSPIHTCLNCSAAIRTGPFCERCGQRNVHVRLEFLDLLDDFRAELLEWHLPWLYTIRAMLLRPGRACREYMDGKRVRYVNPLKYLVYLVTILLIVLQALPTRYGLNPFVDLPGPDLPTQPASNAITAFLEANPVFVVILLAPLIAPLFRLLYSRSKFNNTEVSCFILYTLGNSVLLAAVTHLVVELVGGRVLGIPASPTSEYSALLATKGLLMVIVAFTHTIYTATTFFDEAWYLTWIKVLSVYMVYFLVCAMAIGVITPSAIPASEYVREEDSSAVLNGGSAWGQEEQRLVAALTRADDAAAAFFNANYGFFLLRSGRTDDALYYLLRALDAPTENAELSINIRGLLAAAYMRRGQNDFAATQLNAANVENGADLRLELAMLQGQATDLLALIAGVEAARELNTEVAQLWLTGDRPAALTRIRLAAGTPGVTTAQLAYGARWAALGGDPELAWFLFEEIPDAGKPQLWDSLWMPYFAEVRKLPEFERFLRAEGLSSYWRSSGTWADRCRPVDDNDFECF